MNQLQNSTSNITRVGPRPRNCHLKSWPSFQGYGFHLHAQINKTGQYVKDITPGSPADYGGLKDMDRIIEVNGENIEWFGLNHREVVKRIKSSPYSVTLLVVDEEAEKFYKNRPITKDDPFVVNIYCPEVNPSESSAPLQNPTPQPAWPVGPSTVLTDYEMIHLATFTVEASEMMTEQSIDSKLTEMESVSGLSYIKVKMAISFTEIVINDINSDDILERFPLRQMKHVYSSTKTVKESRILNNLLVFSVAESNNVDIHIFQVIGYEASLVAEILRWNLSLNYLPENFIEHTINSQSKPASSSTAAIAPSASTNPPKPMQDNAPIEIYDSDSNDNSFFKSPKAKKARTTSKKSTEIKPKQKRGRKKKKVPTATLR